MSFAQTYWGQPPGLYFGFQNSVFVESVAIPLQHPGGFKLHVSADPRQTTALARLVLPCLRREMVHHKIVRDDPTYGRLNGGNQAGKFITIYPGPAVVADRVVRAIDPEMLARRFVPGPLVRSRQSRHTELETRIGDSGLVWTLWIDDYSGD